MKNNYLILLEKKYNNKEVYMDKLFYKKSLKKIFKFNKRSLNLFEIQMENYFSIKENNKVQKHNYKLNDDVKLKKGTFMRGEGALVDLTEDRLKFISENGFVSPDITKTYNKNQKTPLTIPVWNIQEDILLKDYINLYSGGTIKVYSLTTKEHYTKLIPFQELDKFVNNLDDCWNWSMEQTKEIRFMPSLAYNRIQVGFIINTQDELTKKLIEYDIFNLNFDKKVLKSFIAKWFRKKFIYGKRDDFTTTRESAIIFGIPENIIEGILVGRNYEKEKEKLEMLKKYFPNCYICNLDGKVIMI